VKFRTAVNHEDVQIIPYLNFTY